MFVVWSLDGVPKLYQLKYEVVRPRKKNQLLKLNYSKTPVTLKGNEKKFELVRVPVIRVDCKIPFATLQIDNIYWFFSANFT